MKDSFDPHNPRVKKARQKHLLNTPPFLALLLLLFIALLTGGIALLYFKHSIGWTLIGFSVLPTMLIFWIKTALTDIPIKKTDNFTDILSENLLLLLFHNYLGKLYQFLPVPFFTNISNLLPSTTEPIYQTARTIRETTQSEEITGAVLAVAIIATIPNHETLLNQLQLTMDDLHQGIIWFNYLNGMVKDAHKPVRTGGIARDFAFGYTPTLQKFAINLSERYAGSHTKLQQADHTKIIDQIIETFTRGGRQNVALIGAYGS